MNRKINLVIIFLVTLSLYGKVLFYGFESDDLLNLNKVSEIVDLKTFLENFYLPTGYDNYFRPIHLLYFLIPYKIFGLQPFVFHLLNLIFYIINLYIFYFLFLRFWNDDGKAFIGTILFALHPAHSHIVPYISLSSELLKGLFLSLSLVFFEARLVYSLIFYFLALLSKESAILFPIIIFSFLLWKDELKGSFKKTVFFIIPAIIYLILRWLTFKDYESFIPLNNPLNNLLIFFASFKEYLKIVFLPYDYTFTYSFLDNREFLESSVGINIFLFLLFIILIIYFFVKDRFLFFAFSFFFTLLLPLLNLFYTVGPYKVGVRYAYLATLSFPLVLITFLYKIKLNFKVRYGLVVLLCIYFFAYSWTNSKIFYNDLTLAKKIYEESKDLKALARLGDSYYRVGDIDNAKKIYEEIIEKNTSLEDENVKDIVKKTISNLSVVYFRLGFIEKAEEILRKGIELFPNDYLLNYNLATLTLNLGKIDDSLIIHLNVLKLKPSKKILAGTYNNIGVIYLTKGNIVEAHKYFSYAYNLYPDNEIYKINYLDTQKILEGR